MAKKKRRATYTPPQTRSKAPGPGQEAKQQSRSAAALTEKQARREQARLQREAARRRYRRLRLIRRGITVLLAAGLVALVVMLLVRTPSTKLIIQPNAAEKAAGCTGVFSVPGFRGENDRGHIGEQAVTQPPLDDYPTQPPTSGPHDPTPLSAGVYKSPPNVYAAIHSLEHAAVVIWVSPKASPGSVAALEKRFGSQEKVIVATYDYDEPGGTLPAGKQMAMTAWHRLETCRKVSVDAVADWVKRFRFTGGAGYEGDAPAEERSAGI